MPANGTGSQDALEDDPEYDPRKSRSRGFDPPPIWDGIDPASTWKSTRRSLHLWAADQTGLPAEVLGVRVFRHSLCGKAKLLADEIEDDDLKASDGFEKIIAFFDGFYAGHIKLEDEKIMDNALDRVHRPQAGRAEEVSKVAQDRRRLPRDIPGQGADKSGGAFTATEGHDSHVE